MKKNNYMYGCKYRCKREKLWHEYANLTLKQHEHILKTEPTKHLKHGWLNTACKALTKKGDNEVQSQCYKMIKFLLKGVLA